MDFLRAAELDHRLAAQVLRGFMRTYVEKIHERAGLLEKRALSPAERKRREQAVTFARSSISLEGFQLSRVEEAHALRFIDSEIDLAEFVAGPLDDT